MKGLLSFAARFELHGEPVIADTFTDELYCCICSLILLQEHFQVTGRVVCVSLPELAPPLLCIACMRCYFETLHMLKQSFCINNVCSMQSLT